MKIIIHMGDAYRDETPTGKRMRVFYESFTAHGHEVKLLVPKINGRSENKDVIECAVIPLKKKTSLYRFLNSVSYGITSVFASLKAGPTDVVLTTSPPPLISMFGWLIAKMKRAALIYDVRDIWPDVAWEMGSFSRDSLYSKVFAFIRDFMLRHADLVTTVSKGKIEKLSAYEPKADILHVSNGFDVRFLENVDEQELADRYGMDKKFTCIYAGNIGLGQGLQQLLQLAEQAKAADLPVQFLLFGGGADEQKLRRYASEHHLDNVSFCGYLPSRQIYTCLKHADMCIVTIVNGNVTDSIPSKIYEALGVGCPVLLCAAGESVELLEESQLGVAVPPGDPDALWNAFLQMYQTMPEILGHREKAQRLMVEKYSRQHISEILEEEIQNRFSLAQEGGMRI